MMEAKARIPDGSLNGDLSTCGGRLATASVPTTFAVPFPFSPSAAAPLGSQGYSGGRRVPSRAPEDLASREATAARINSRNNGSRHNFQGHRTPTGIQEKQES